MVKNKNTYVSDYNYIPVIAEYCKLLNLDKSIHTIISYLSSIDRFFDFLKIETTKDINDITPFMCREYQAKLKEDGLQSSSINAHVRNLKALFNWLKENEKINDNPFEKVKNVKEPKKELSFLSEEEVDMMLVGCKNLEEKTIIALLISLGLRRSELVNLKVSDLDDYKVNVTGKGTKYRPLYLQEDVYKLLQDYLENRKYKEFEYVFRSKSGSKYTPEAIRLKIKSIAKRAGIDDKRIEVITPHTMRRTAATNMVENGTDIRIIQGILGHVSLSTTTRYAKLRNSAVEKAMRNQRAIV